MKLLTKILSGMGMTCATIAVLTIPTWIVCRILGLDGSILFVIFALSIFLALILLCSSTALTNNDNEKKVSKD